MEAFRSTLEEATDADVILLADAASPDPTSRSKRCGAVGEIGAGDIPEVLAMNKIDHVAGSAGAARAPVPRIGGRLTLTGEGQKGC